MGIVSCRCTPVAFEIASCWYVCVCFWPAYSAFKHAYRSTASNKLLNKHERALVLFKVSFEKQVPYLKAL